MATFSTTNLLARFTGSTTWDTAVVDLSGSYPSRHQLAPIVAALKQVDTLEGITQRLRSLADDENCRAVVVRVHGLTCSLATAAALNKELRRLHETTEVRVSLQEITMVSVLATVGVTEVTAPPSADVMMFGFALEQVFLGAFLKRHGITFENMRIREYKSALTRFSDEKMDEHNRAQLSAYVNEAEDQWLSDVAAGRQVPVHRVREWLDATLTSAHAAAEAGVIDRVAYEDDLFRPVASRPLDGIDRLLSGLASRRHTDRVAIIPVMGTIVAGKNQGSPFGARRAASEPIVANLRRAKNDEHTRAIVLHVDSGGGSALASDLICREVATSDKPVVAVMGSVAASGGYYVLAEADHVIASPYTITGSIGVVVGKPVIGELQQRHGFHPETVGRTDALFTSTSRGFTDRQRAWAEAMMGTVYDQFRTVVARGRDLTMERVDEIGRGRIWSGRAAQGLGLVDVLGTPEDAVREARRQAGLKDDAPVWVPSAPRLPVPEVGRRPSEAATAWLWPFGREQVLTLWDDPVRLI